MLTSILPRCESLCGACGLSQASKNAGKYTGLSSDSGRSGGMGSDNISSGGYGSQGFGSHDVRRTEVSRPSESSYSRGQVSHGANHAWLKYNWDSLLDHDACWSVCAGFIRSSQNQDLASSGSHWTLEDQEHHPLPSANACKTCVPVLRLDFLCPCSCLVSSFLQPVKRLSSTSSTVLLSLSCVSPAGRSFYRNRTCSLFGDISSFLYQGAW